jgi:hypothetical protein
VIRVHGRIIVSGIPDAPAHLHDHTPAWNRDPVKLP